MLVEESDESGDEGEGDRLTRGMPPVSEIVGLGGAQWLG